MAKENQRDQSARFDQAVAEMVDAGELSPTEAAAAFDRLMDRVTVEKSESHTDSR